MHNGQKVWQLTYSYELLTFILIIHIDICDVIPRDNSAHYP